MTRKARRSKLAQWGVAFGAKRPTKAKRPVKRPKKQQK